MRLAWQTSPPSRLNDTLGHTAGDRVLERIADLLRSEVRSSDLLGYQPDAERPPALHARFGGDEFCFFLSDLDDAEVACAIGERFWYAVAEYDWVTEDLRVATPKVTRGYRRHVFTARAAQRPSTQCANYREGPLCAGGPPAL